VLGPAYPYLNRLYVLAVCGDVIGLYNTCYVLMTAWVYRICRMSRTYSYMGTRTYSCSRDGWYDAEAPNR